MIQPLGLHQPSCNLCCSAPVYSQAPPSPSSTGTEGVGAVHCVVSQFMMVISLQVLTASPQQHGLSQPQQGCGQFQCKAATRILSVCHKQSTLWQWSGACYSSWVSGGIYVPSSIFSKSDASLFTT